MDKILIQGFLISGLYSLMALGFTLIYSVGGVLNLSHAAYVMVAGYAYYWATYMLGFSPIIGILIAMSVGIILALFTYISWVRRFLDNPNVIFVSTIIFSLLLEHIMSLIFFRENVNIPPIIEGVINFRGYSIPIDLILAVAVSWVCIIIILFFVKNTNTGRAIRAVSMDKKAAMICGIDPGKINLIVWALSGAMSGIAGVFYGSHSYLTPDMWVTPLIMSFAIVIIGGIGSIEGAIIGAHIVGFAEAITVLGLNERLRSVPGLVIMIIVLLTRPKGIFGR